MGWIEVMGEIGGAIGELLYGYSNGGAALGHGDWRNNPVMANRKPNFSAGGSLRNRAVRIKPHDPSYRPGYHMVVLGKGKYDLVPISPRGYANRNISYDKRSWHNWSKSKDGKEFLYHLNGLAKQLSQDDKKNVINRMTAYTWGMYLWCNLRYFDRYPTILGLNEYLLDIPVIKIKVESLKAPDIFQIDIPAFDESRYNIWLKASYQVFISKFSNMTFMSINYQAPLSSGVNDIWAKYNLIYPYKLQKDRKIILRYFIVDIITGMRSNMYKTYEVVA